MVHAATVAQAPRSGSRAAMKDMNVIGAMQLFAVCQKSPSVRKVVLRSASAVYGGSPGDPAKFTEEMGARRPPRGAWARDCIDIEGYARAMGRRRRTSRSPSCGSRRSMGPHRHGWVARYLSSPIVPRILGRDARMQLLHEEDALAALHRATVTGPTGTFNVAGDGIVMMSQAVRRAGRVEVPMPFALFRSAGRALMGSQMRSFTHEQLDYFHFGCGLDTHSDACGTRIRAALDHRRGARRLRAGHRVDPRDPTGVGRPCRGHGARPRRGGWRAQVTARYSGKPRVGVAGAECRGVGTKGSVVNEVAKVIPLHADARARSTRDRPVDPRPSRPAADTARSPNRPSRRTSTTAHHRRTRRRAAACGPASPVRWPVPQSSRAVGWPATTR